MLPLASQLIKVEVLSFYKVNRPYLTSLTSSPMTFLPQHWLFPFFAPCTFQTIFPSSNLLFSPIIHMWLSFSPPSIFTQLPSSKWHFYLTIQQQSSLLLPLGTHCTPFFDFLKVCQQWNMLSILYTFLNHHSEC